MNDALVPVNAESAGNGGLFLQPSARRVFHLGNARQGWHLSDHPVELEPTLCPLYALLSAPEPPVTDDGRKPTFWSNLFGGKDISNNNTELITYGQELAEYHQLLAQANTPEFCDYYAATFVELQLILPRDLKLTKTVAENLLLSFSYLWAPVSFEIIGSESEIIVQFVSTEADSQRVKEQLRAHLPECRFRETGDYLLNHWINAEETVLIVDFGLANDCFLPLKTSSGSDADYLTTVIGALANLQGGEIGVFQILFQKCKKDWAREIIQSVSYMEESGDFPKSWGRLGAARDKTTTPLFAASIRAAGRSANNARTWSIVKAVGAGLSSFAAPSGNELIPLSNEGFAPEYHEQALVDRHSYRSGMLLNLDELASLVHPPPVAVQSKKLLRESDQTKCAPALAIGHQLVLGDNVHQNEAKQVSLSNEQRTRHIHIIGASGGGKSSLLLNMIVQDLENDQGLCVIDPHGDLIDSVIGNVPEHRINDVALFDPADSEYPIGFNILSANSELEKTLLSSDLVATFRRMSTSWGDVMDSVLANALLAFIESSKGGTLFDLKRFLVEKDFRNEFLQTVKDDAIRYFWQNEFPLITGKPQSSILIRLDAFLRQKIIRNIVCQKKNKIDFRVVMDERKILLVKLSQGLIGEENSTLLGTFLVSKLYQTAISRQDSQNRPFFSCYLDEFHHFVTPSMENILSGARKYNLGLVLAHQEFRQLQSRSADVAASVLSNCYTRICFRLGDTDAEKFASGFSFFDGAALQNLGIGEAVGRVERAEFDFNLKTNLPSKIDQEIAESRKTSVVQNSRERYGAPLSEVEADLAANRPPIEESPATKAEKSRQTESRAVKETISNEQPAKSNGKENTQTDNAHRYLQNVVKRVGENAGFVATLEKQVFGGVGRIDVALENERLKIACEIAATNTVDYEVQNIQKCLASGFDKVAVISADTKHLAAIRQKARTLISDEQSAKVYYLEPDNFHLFLESLNSRANAESKVKGYNVKSSFKEPSEAEAKTRKQIVFDIISNLVSRQGKK